MHLSPWNSFASSSWKLLPRVAPLMPHSAILGSVSTLGSWDCGVPLQVTCLQTLSLGTGLDHAHGVTALYLHAPPVPLGVHECTVHGNCSLATLPTWPTLQDLLFQEWAFTLLWIGAPPRHCIGIPCLWPGWYSMLNWYADRVSNHLAILSLGSLRLYSHLSAW